VCGVELYVRSKCRVCEKSWHNSFTFLHFNSLILFPLTLPSTWRRGLDLMLTQFIEVTLLHYQIRSLQLFLWLDSQLQQLSRSLSASHAVQTLLVRSTPSINAVPRIEHAAEGTEVTKQRYILLS